MKKRIFYFILMVFIVVMAVSCGKKKKRKWRELGASPSEVVEFGVHPERGSNDEEPVYLGLIYIPTGENKQGVQQYKKIIYELEELSGEELDYAFKDLGLISEEALFCDVMIKSSEGYELVGPGGKDPKEKIETDGLVRYVVDDNYSLDSSLVNEEDYEDINITNFEGRIKAEDVVNAITMTFKENYQFVNCELAAATYAEYLKEHPAK